MESLVVRYVPGQPRLTGRPPSNPRLKADPSIPEVGQPPTVEKHVSAYIFYRIRITFYIIKFARKTSIILTSKTSIIISGYRVRSVRESGTR